MIVCHCHRVTDLRVDGVLAAGADGVRGVVRATRAGTGCGGCIPALRELCTRSAAAAVQCQDAHDESLAG